MTDQAAAFLRTIIEQPDDDLPRLIFADWLDEHGEPERAEFIRVQCMLASGACLPGVCTCRQRCDQLRDRERELLNDNNFARLIGPVARLPMLDLPPGGDRGPGWDRRKLTMFRRGFVDEVRMAWNRAHIAAIREATPLLRKVVLTTWPNRAWVIERHRGRKVPIGLFGRIQVDAARDALAAEFPGLEFELPSIGIAVDAA